MAARDSDAGGTSQPPPIARPERVTELLSAPRKRRRSVRSARPARSRRAPRDEQRRRRRTRMKPVRKAVFPVAGLGTRFLPATKAIPKEMLTDRRPTADPVCGRRGARGGDRADDLRHRPRQGRARGSFRHRLRARGDDDGARQVARRARRTRFPPGAIVSVRQQEPLGLGHAVWCAREIVGDEPFAVLLPDDLMVGRPGCLAQMVDAYDKVGGNIVCAAGRAARANRQLRHHHARRARRPADRGQGPGREAQPRGRRRRRSASSAATSSSPRSCAILGQIGKGRRRRDPADRRDGALIGTPAVPRPDLRRRAPRLRRQDRLRRRQSRAGAASATTSRRPSAPFSPAIGWSCAPSSSAMARSVGSASRRRPPIAAPASSGSISKVGRKPTSRFLTAQHDIPDVAASALVATETRPRCDRIDDGAIVNLRGPGDLEPDRFRSAGLDPLLGRPGQGHFGESPPAGATPDVWT